MIRDFDMFDQEQGRHRWDLFGHARQHCPVSQVPGNRVLLTRYEDVRYVLERPELFSSSGVSPQPTPLTINPLDADPPYHSDLRKLLNPLFSRSACLKFTPEMQRIANELVDGFVDAGEVEVIGGFAAPFVAAVLARIVFSERATEQMRAAVDAVTRVAVTGDPQSYLDLSVIAHQYLAGRREHGSSEEDVLGAVTTGTVLDGRRLTDDQQLGVLIALFLGGLDTTRGAIGMIIHELTKDPGLRARLCDPSWQRRDMDEFVRHASPVACLCRTVVEDTEVNGVMLSAGQQVLVRFDAANHDPEQFEDPENLRFDLTRPGNAAFGLGIHRCLGAHLARVQIGVAFDVLLTRLTNLRPKHPDQAIHYIFGIARGPERVEVLFDRA
jgi:cytochrome P450